MIHEIKIEPRWLQRLLTGQKSFEVRFNDRDYQVGDILRMRPLLPSGFVDAQAEPFLMDVVYAHMGLGVRDGFIVLGVKPCEVSAGLDRLIEEARNA